MMTLTLVLFGAFALAHAPLSRRVVGGDRPADRAAVALGLTWVVCAVSSFRSLDAPFLFGCALIVGALCFIPRVRALAGWASLPLSIGLAWAGEDGVGSWPVIVALPLFLGWSAWVGLGHLPGRALRRWMFARMYDKAMVRYSEWSADRRRALLADLEGEVVELGPGTGANLPYFSAAVRWRGIEPNAHMRALLEKQAVGLGRAIAWSDSLDELEDASVDAVVSTLVLCSVPDTAGVLREVRRVLKAGGRLCFMEHVAAKPGSGLRRIQRLARPVWSFLADGCCPDRELWRDLDEAGFETLEIEHYVVPREVALRIIEPHVQGFAINPSSR